MNKEQEEAFQQFSKEQLTKYREAFDLFDKDSNGKVSAKELGSFMRQMGMCPTPSELDDMVNEVDADGSGCIDFPEFLALMARKIDEGDNEDDVLDAFRMFDRDGNGFIAVEELRHVMSTLGEKMTDDEIEEMVKMAVVDSDGLINYEEFVKLLLISHH